MRAPFPPFAWKTLPRGLTTADRRGLAAGLGALLRFQRTLGGWRTPQRAPDATPFVSLYAGGRLCGCYGCGEGGPGERLARAFLRALDDGRFGGVQARERADVTAQVSYVRRATLVNPDTVADELELGMDGVAIVREGGHGTLLLPEVARDERIGGREVVRRLALKAGLGPDGLAGQAVYRLETERVVVRPGGPFRGEDARGLPAALGWLASLVAADGRVTFAVDPRARTRSAVGVMHHARASVVAHALAEHGTTGAHRAAARRARAKLLADARKAVGGGAVEGWPTDPAQVAGTLALLVRGGVPVSDALRTFVTAHDVTSSAWHCAQVVAILGHEAPEPLWSACLADLDIHPWAPWTLLAADARRDRAVRERVARALASGLRDHSPHRGAGIISEIPEVALTALAVEALARHPASWARSAVRRARSFLAGTQLAGDRLYGALDARLATGAFPVSPVADWLRCDVTAHAVLALGPDATWRSRSAG
jgi:AMMECR1 domain-containing protein